MLKAVRTMRVVVLLPKVFWRVCLLVRCFRIMMRISRITTFMRRINWVGINIINIIDDIRGITVVITGSGANVN